MMKKPQKSDFFMCQWISTFPNLHLPHPVPATPLHGYREKNPGLPTAN